MKVLGAVLLCLCALTVRAAPALSESFNASLLVQYIGGSCLSTIVRDAETENEYWTLLNEPENIYAGQLMDYRAGRSFNILHFGPLQGCFQLPITGGLPKFWDWLATAQSAGEAEYMNTRVMVYAGKDAAGNYHEVGVSVEDQARPVYTVLSTNRTSVQFTWLEYSPRVVAADFSVPMECGRVPSLDKPMGGLLNFFNLNLPNYFRP